MRQTSFPPLTEAQRALVRQWEGLARHVVGKLWHLGFVQRLGLDECRAVGYLALCAAAQGYREDRGVAFQTYAHKVIALEICKAARTDGLIHVPVYLAYGGRGQSDPRGTLPARLGRAALCRRVASLGSAAEGGPELDVPAPEGPGPAEREEAERVRGLVAAAGLTAREGRVLEWRYALGWKLRRIADALDISVERARQLQISILHKLRVAAGLNPQRARKYVRYTKKLADRRVE